MELEGFYYLLFDTSQLQFLEKLTGYKKEFKLAYFTDIQVDSYLHFLFDYKY